MSAQTTELSLLNSPQPYAASQVMASPVTGLLVSGIVNPFGPTVNAIIAVGKLKPGARLPVVRLVLNPFQQEVEEVGTLAFGKAWRPSTVIPQLFRLRTGSCPSLILPLEQLKRTTATSLFAEFLRGFEDARGVYDRVREYYGNPWDRVSYEMALATEHVTNFDSHARGKQKLLNEDESRQLAELLLADEHGGPEVQALLRAWSGSIRHNSSPALASLPMDQFSAVLMHICSEVRIPPAPADVTPTQTPEEMKARVEKLQHEGRMPSLDQILVALRDAAADEEERQSRKKRGK